jgi:hypothetical protein
MTVSDKRILWRVIRVACQTETSDTQGMTRQYIHSVQLLMYS